MISPGDRKPDFNGSAGETFPFNRDAVAWVLRGPGRSAGPAARRPYSEFPAARLGFAQSRSAATPVLLRIDDPVAPFRTVGPRPVTGEYDHAAW